MRGRIEGHKFIIWRSTDVRYTHIEPNKMVKGKRCFEKYFNSFNTYV